MLEADRELLWLRRVRDLSHRLASEQDLRRLLPAILDAAIEITDAERGFLVRVHGRRPDGTHRIKVEVARGFDRASLGRSRNNVSRTVVRRVLERGERGLVTTSEEDQDVVQVPSVQAKRVRSIICVPMCLRGEQQGVLYLDHRFSDAAFGPEHLPILRSFADQAALALETAQLLESGPGPDAAPVRALEELEAAPDPPAGFRRFGGLIGASPAMRALYGEVERAARSWAPVLVLGESGAGKERVAREIHARGARAGGPFVVKHCASLTDALLADHAAGLAALLAQAHGGSLFLEEVAEMSPAFQARLLEALAGGALDAPAPGQPPPACRILASTRRDLRERVGAGQFRAELYYRLDVLRLVVPPLRQRPGDVALLLEELLARTSRRVQLSAKARELLEAYAWPGNVRELENEVQRLLHTGEARISSRQLSPEVRAGRGVARARGSYAGKTLSEVEREMLATALAECRGNKSRAARQLGIPRSTLYHLLERYDLA